MAGASGAAAQEPIRVDGRGRHRTEARLERQAAAAAATSQVNAAATKGLELLRRMVDHARVVARVECQAVPDEDLAGALPRLIAEARERLDGVVVDIERLVRRVEADAKQGAATIQVPVARSDHTTAVMAARAAAQRAVEGIQASAWGLHSQAMRLSTELTVAGKSMSDASDRIDLARRKLRGAEDAGEAVAQGIVERLRRA